MCDVITAGGSWNTRVEGNEHSETDYQTDELGMGKAVCEIEDEWGLLLRFAVCYSIIVMWALSRRQKILHSTVPKIAAWIHMQIHSFLWDTAATCEATTVPRTLWASLQMHARAFGSFPVLLTKHAAHDALACRRVGSCLT